MSYNYPGGAGGYSYGTGQASSGGGYQYGGGQSGTSAYPSYSASGYQQPSASGYQQPSASGYQQPSASGYPQPGATEPPVYRWWIPAEGIHRKVLQEQICLFLGRGAISKPEKGVGENEGVPGYKYSGMREFTEEQLEYIKKLSAMEAANPTGSSSGRPSGSGYGATQPRRDDTQYSSSGQYPRGGMYPSTQQQGQNPTTQYPINEGQYQQSGYPPAYPQTGYPSGQYTSRSEQHPSYPTTSQQTHSPAPQYQQNYTFSGSSGNTPTGGAYPPSHSPSNVYTGYTVPSAAGGTPRYPDATTASQSPGSAYPGYGVPSATSGGTTRYPTSTTASQSSGYPGYATTQTQSSTATRQGYYVAADGRQYPYPNQP